MKREAAVPAMLGVCLVVFVAVCVGLRPWFPPYWPDEVLFAQPAISLVHEGHFGMPLYGGLVPGMDRLTYWQPPLYALILAPVVAVAGLDVVALRTVSLVFGCAGIVLVFLVAHAATRDRRAALIAAAATAVDPMWIRVSNLARMDVVAVVFTLGALAIYARARASGRPTPRLVAAGAVATLAFLTHPLGGLAYAVICVHLVAFEPDLRRARNFVALFSPGVAGALAWGLFASVDVAAFASQMRAQLARKSVLSPGERVWEVLAQYGVGPNASHVAQAHGRTERFPQVVALYAIAVALGTWSFARRRDAPGALAVLAATGSVAAAMAGGEGWYPPYFAPHLYVLLALALARPPRAGARVATLAAVALAAAGSAFGLGRIGYLHRVTHAEATSYARFAAEIFRDIPDGARVYMACLPDPSFYLDGRKRLDVVEVIPPDFPVDREGYRRMIASRDFLVLSYRWYTDRLLTEGDDVIEAAIAAGERRVVGTPGGPGYAALVVHRR